MNSLEVPVPMLVVLDSGDVTVVEGGGGGVLDNLDTAAQS